MLQSLAAFLRQAAFTLISLLSFLKSGSAKRKSESWRISEWLVIGEVKTDL